MGTPPDTYLELYRRKDVTAWIGEHVIGLHRAVTTRTRHERGPVTDACLNDQVSGHSASVKADANVKTTLEIVHVTLIKSTVGEA